MPTFSSVPQALHWAFLVDGGAALEVRGSRAHVASGNETRTIDLGDMSATDLRTLCARALRDARAKVSADQWAALRARFGHGVDRAEGFGVLIDRCTAMADTDLAADAIALFRDVPATTAGARLLSSVRAALVAHAVDRLSPGFLPGHIATA